MEYEPLLRPDDVSKMLGVPIATLYRWRYIGFGPAAIKVGRHLRWRRSTIEKWLAAREI
jgi:predicted DNA-binding transcriptional regulator AlpA